MRRTSVISIEQKQELKEAFNEFDRDGSGFINTKVRNRHQSKKKHKINTKVKKNTKVSSQKSFQQTENSS